MNKISAIIVVKNNPHHLFEMLTSIDDFVSEIIIGNINIPDQVKTILLENKRVHMVEIPKETPFADLVKEDLKKKATGSHILYLDPDEILSGPAIKIMKENLAAYDYFLIPRKNIIFGKWIRHSRWWPDYQLRLFKKDSVIWPKTLHPVAQPKGKGYRFEPDEKFAILHYNYDSIDQYLEKAMRYAKFEARSYRKLNKDYSLTDVFGDTTSEFIGRYFGSEGYRDGLHGLTLAFLQMFYYFLVYFYVWEHNKYRDSEENENRVRSFFRQLLFEANFWIVKKKRMGLLGRIRLRLENILLRIFD